jgi:hypothetical protein
MTNELARDRVAESYDSGWSEALTQAVAVVEQAGSLADAHRLLLRLADKEPPDVPRGVHCESCGGLVRDETDININY